MTLDRPAVLNAMDLRMHEELAAVWDDIEADDGIRVAVLTGAGHRAFSVGQDLRERSRLDEQGVPRTSFGSRGGRRGGPRRPGGGGAHRPTAHGPTPPPPGPSHRELGYTNRP
ncbi:enoyl-CoA hydratase-related protein, partial [Kitasatospora sp. NPDC096128]|uniref:enoyl-CoA hydratase-related protein n=1 Tax=Kitasatospora sp. NPDC096128 TaxID=3155547 RepID=UPI00332EB0E7